MTRFALILLFYVVVTPIAAVVRLFGGRPLELSIESDRDTYWVSADHLPSEASEH